MKATKNPQTPTIYDVASLAGLSIATVSRVINTPDKVQEETRAKVMAAVDELGFVPKAEARARALRNSQRIGVLTPFFTAPSFVQRLRGVTSVLAALHYEMIIYTVDSLSRLKGYLANLPLKGELDGLIVMSLPIEQDEMRRLMESRLEIVSIETHQDAFSSVEIDDFAGGEMAANFLLEKGHRCFGFIGDMEPPDYAIQPVANRLRGFVHRLSAAGVSIDPQAIRTSPYQQEFSRQAAYQLLSMPQRPTAIFAAADVQAIAVMKVAGDMGIKIPNELAVIGFDDLEMADYVGLSTISQSLDDSGRIAAELLLSRLDDLDRPIQHVWLPLTVIERDTT